MRSTTTNKPNLDHARYRPSIWGRYLAIGLNNEEKITYDFNEEYALKDFSPGALARTSLVRRRAPSFHGARSFSPVGLVAA